MPERGVGAKQTGPSSNGSATLRRARTPEQKQSRLDVLLDVAWQLLQDRPYEAITMSVVADMAGLAKGTPYRYVRTKEELFLAVAGRQLARWFDGIDARADSATTPWTADEAAVLLTNALAGWPALIRLLGLLHPVIEQNVDRETVLEFKRLVEERRRSTGARIEARVRGFRAGQGESLLLRLYALVIGLQQLAAPVPGLSQGEGVGAKAPLLVDFESELRAAVSALLRGMASGEA